MTIKEYLNTHKLLTDGAMGSYYSLLERDSSHIAEEAVFTNPEKIIAIHKEYLHAGAMLLRTDTFAAGLPIFASDQRKQEQLIRLAVGIARRAVKEYLSETGNNNEIRPFIAGDIGPLPETFETEHEDALNKYLRIADLFIEEGVDAVVFETFPGEEYPVKAAEYIKNKAPELFIMAEATLDQYGYAANGMNAEKILTLLAKSPYIDACGFNCGIGSGHMLSIVKGIALPKGKYFMTCPNAGYPEQMQNRMIYRNNALYFAENLEQLAFAGADIIGACCGSTPEYIRLTKQKLEQPVASRLQAERTFSRAVFPDSEIEKEIASQANETFDFAKLLESGKKVVACELDPPYQADDTKIMDAARLLKKCGVDIITIADSPMGRSRIDSVLMASKINHETGMMVMPHLSCRDRNRIAMRSSLLGAYINQIRTFLFVTGDPVPQDARLTTTGVFDYSSIRLMEYTRELNRELFTESPVVYGGALNYSASNVTKLIEKMERKIDAGAQFFLTQPIFSEEDMERVALLKSKVKTKILCGIIPLTSYTNANFIRNEITGIHVPEAIVNRYHKEMTKEEAEITGAQIANELVTRLDSFADGYYFMLQFNRASFMEKIIV